jgi:hypothetical protein
MPQPKLSKASLAKLAQSKAARDLLREKAAVHRKTQLQGPRKTLAQKEYLETKPGFRQAPGTKVNKYAREMASNNTSRASDNAIENAYTLALLNPMANSGAKLPDQWAVPSTAKHLEFEITVTPVLDAVSGYYYAGICFTDSLGAATQVITGAASGTFTWGGYSASPHYTTLSSYIDRYRLVSALLRLENGTAAASLQGRAYSLQGTTSSASTFGPGKIADLTATSSRVRSFQLNDINVTPCCRYIPFIDNASNGSTTSGQSPDEWNVIADNSPNMSLSIVCQLAANTGADMVFRCYSNLELVPLTGAQFVIPTSVEIAMPNDAAKARRRLLQHDQGWEGDLESAVNSTVQLAKQVGRTAMSVSRAASTIWSGITGGFANPRDRRQAYQAAHFILARLGPGDSTSAGAAHDAMVASTRRVYDASLRAETNAMRRSNWFDRVHVEEKEERPPSPARSVYESDYSVVSPMTYFAPNVCIVNPLRGPVKSADGQQKVSSKVS